MELASTQENDESHRAADLEHDLQQLRERVEKEGGEAQLAVQIFLPLLHSLKALETEESVLHSDYAELEAGISRLERKLTAGCEKESLSDDLDRLLVKATEELNSAKKLLAAKLRAVVSVKRQLDDVPTQSELIQYECGFSELNAHIQEKHQQTSKYYATYNALLEIKELMIKETSLSSSISSQFQNAITSADGRMKLIDSMEGILKGSQQDLFSVTDTGQEGTSIKKLQKVQFRLQEEQKACDAVKKRHAAAIAAQRRYYSLLKAFQEECAKNERLKEQKSV